jgi:hypothetical protein
LSDSLGGNVNWYVIENSHPSITVFSQTLYHSMTFRYLIIWILLCINLAVDGQPLGFSLPEGKSRVDIPIEIYNNLPVVSVILNEQLPLKFIIDTGVRTAILTDKSYSDILQIKYTKKYSLTAPGGEKLFDAYVASNVRIDLPGVHGEGCALFVLEKDYLELSNHLGITVHGILGYELFSRFVVKIDYERKIMTLIKPEHFKPKKNFVNLPITIEDTKPYLLAPVQLSNGSELGAKLLIDTGASHGLLLDPQSDNRIEVPSLFIKSNIGRGLGGAITGKMGRIKNLSIGKYQIKDLIVNFPDPESYLDTTKMGKVTFRNGSIGGELLNRFTIIFNFAKGKIYLKKNSSLNKVQYFNMSGISLVAKGSKLNEFEIDELRDYSAAAEAGLKQGDAIVSINNYSTSDLSLNQVNSFLTERPGKKVSVVVKRNNLLLKKVFRLRFEL